MSKPAISEIKANGDILTFTLSGVNVSLANALRRTIISDIPTVVFRTSPYEENKANITVNTSRLNNEILKQRLSCIPIHITDHEIPLKDYLMEIDEENNTDTMMFVTTENFKIKNLQTNQYLSEKDTRAIFPPNDQTGYFIDFVRLRPRISDEIPGEKISLTCEFSIHSPKVDSMFNSSCTCAYGFTVDDVKQEQELAKKMQQWKDSGLNDEQIDFETKNWKLLDGLRITKKDSFDFTVETVGVFESRELVHKACDILVERIQKFHTMVDTDELPINLSQTTMSNCFDLTLVNEDYTIGKALECILYSKYFEQQKVLTFCGFKKMHPHDADSIIRLAYLEPVDKPTVRHHVKDCFEIIAAVFQEIRKQI